MFLMGRPLVLRTTRFRSIRTEPWAGPGCLVTLVMIRVRSRSTTWRPLPGSDAGPETTSGPRPGEPPPFFGVTCRGVAAGAAGATVVAEPEPGFVVEPQAARQITASIVPPATASFCLLASIVPSSLRPNSPG